MPAKKQGLYANIHAKQERIKNGSGEHMRKKGEDGAPDQEDFDKSEKTAAPAKKTKKPAAKKAAAKKTAAKKAPSRKSTQSKTKKS
jgi:hypothetical protein